MVKPKKPEIGVWKTVQLKVIASIKRQSRNPLESFRLNLKNNEMQKILVGLINPNNQDHLQNTFHSKNRQWNNFSTSMLFPSYGSPMHMPWGADFNLPYSCGPWFIISYMSSLPTYLCPNYIITYREPAISKPSPTNNGCFDPKN